MPVDASYRLTVKTCMGGGRPQECKNHTQVKIIRKEFLEICKESGYFGEFEEGETGDVFIDASLSLEESSPWVLLLAAVSGFTMGAIPCYTNSTYTFEVAVTAQDGRLKRYSYSDGGTFAIWLPLVLVAPFKTPASAIVGTRKNIFRTAIHQMHKDGLLASP